MFKRWSGWLTPPTLDDPDKNRSLRFLHLLLLGLIATLGPLAAASLLFFPQFDPRSLFLIGSVLGLMGILWWARRGHTVTAGTAMLLLIWAFGTLAVLNIGTVRAPAISIYLLVALMAGFILPRWASFAMVAWCALSALVMLIAELRGVMQADFTAVPPVAGFVLTLIVLIIITLLVALYRDQLTQALTQAQRNADDLAAGNLTLQQMHSSLEQRVSDRTRYLELLVTINEQLNSILDLDSLMGVVVNQTRDLFGYYHVHIYLRDGRGETLEVVEGTGPAGAAMKVAGHRIPMAAATSLVARAAREQRVVRVDAVREAPDWLPNPLLPETQSEMAVPIVLDETVEGVLDLQSDRLEGFTEEDERLMALLAAQVAVAIRNARLFEQTQTALAEAQMVQTRYQQQAWARYRRQAPVLAAAAGHTTENGQSAQLSLLKTNALRARQTLTRHQPSDAANGNGTAPDAATLITPLRLGGDVIGTLGLRDASPGRRWTENEVALVEAVAQQVSQALEEARLLDELQQRAAREQLTRQIADQMRRVPDVASIIETGLTELNRALGSNRAYVRLNPSRPDID